MYFEYILKYVCKGGFMKKFKNVIVLVLLLSLIMPLVACQNDEEVKALPQLVKVWTYFNGQQKRVMDAMVEEFNNTTGKEHNIIVEQVSFSRVDELNKAILDAANDDLGAESLPDVFVTYLGIGMEVDRLKGLVDFNTYISEDELATFVPEFLNMGMVEDRLLMYPFIRSADIMMLNSTDFEEFAAATGSSYEELSTLEGLINLSEKYYNYTDAMTEEEHDGQSFFSINSIPNYLFNNVHQINGELLIYKDGKTQINFPREVARKIWDIYYVPMIKGYFGRYSKFVSEDIKTGRVLGGVCSSTGIAFAPKQTFIGDKVKDIEVIVLPTPNIEGKDKSFIIQGGGIFLTASDEKREKAGVEFIKWITNVQNNSTFAQKTSYLPVLTEAFSKEYIENYYNDSDMDEVVVNGVVETMKQFEISEPYFPKVIPKYEEFRLIVLSELKDFCQRNVETMGERVKAGEDYDSVLSEYLSDDTFDKWYDGFMNKVNILLSE